MIYQTPDKKEQIFQNREHEANVFNEIESIKLIVPLPVISYHKVVRSTPTTAIVSY